jgi:hypothetical protein
VTIPRWTCRHYRAAKLCRSLLLISKQTHMPCCVGLLHGSPRYFSEILLLESDSRHQSLTPQLYRSAESSAHSRGISEIPRNSARLHASACKLPSRRVHCHFYEVFWANRPYAEVLSGAKGYRFDSCRG